MKKEFNVTRMVWSGSRAPLSAMSASAPEPPPLLFGISGSVVRSFFSATDWMKRAIWSAPPPAPAMITKSIGFFGCHSAAALCANARPASAVAPATPLKTVLLVLIGFSLLSGGPEAAVNCAKASRTHGGRSVLFGSCPLRPVGTDRVGAPQWTRITGIVDRSTTCWVLPPKTVSRSWLWL